MQIISNLLLPFMIFVVLFYGALKKVSIYDVFLEGAKESYEMVLNLFPCMLGMILGVNLLLKGGFFSYLVSFLSFLPIPKEVIPMALLRSVSGSTTLALMNHLFENYGPDSMIGRLASVIQGSTDTTIYVLTLYFGSVGIRKTKYALKVGLFADLIGVISSILAVRLFFGR